MIKKCVGTSVKLAAHTHNYEMVKQIPRLKIETACIIQGTACIIQGTACIIPD